MSVIYSQSTYAFLTELTEMSKITHDESDSHLKTRSKLKGIRRKFEADTSKFEPIPENRENLIKTLMPMVVRIAKTVAKRYGTRVEYNDCISAGMHGAIMGTDIYIERAKTFEHTAKLSTFAHSYITKYVNEHAYQFNSILSHGPTKWYQASSTHVMAGNQTYSDEGRSVEFFDIANDANLMTVEDYEDVSEQVESATNELFQSLTLFDKQVLFLSFGIGSKNSKPLQPREIAKILNCTLAKVTETLQSAIISIQESVDTSRISDIVSTLKQKDLQSSLQWDVKI